MRTAIFSFIFITSIPVFATASPSSSSCDSQLVSRTYSNAIQMILEQSPSLQRHSGAHPFLDLPTLEALLLESERDLERTQNPVPGCQKLAQGLGLAVKGACQYPGYLLKMGLARGYRAFLDYSRNQFIHVGPFFRKYFSAQDVAGHLLRWMIIEGLYKEGDFRGSFGHIVPEGFVEIESPLVFPESHLPIIQSQKISLGRNLVLPSGEERAISHPVVSPMVSISGMSFPQLSAQSHLSLLYIHLRLAKDHGVRTLFNTGEGGPRFHLALLEGDQEALTQEVVEWNRKYNEVPAASWDEAKIRFIVDRLMKSRDTMLKEFTEDELKQAQLVAQFGGALNGIRNPLNRVDFDKLREVAKSPYVAMIQFKLKQAAKRGAKVDPRKIDYFVAALREIPRGKPFKSPEVNPELDSAESIAELIVATKIATRKPVSIKFGIGDPVDIYEVFQVLRDANALPDHIQLDGRGQDFSPGSGNAPFGANTSLPINEAIIVMDAVLKKLGIRDQIYLEATGDTLLPAEAIEKLALGADGVSAARLWLGMGLGCAQVRACANGGCPYGIASQSQSIFAMGLDPQQVAPKGLEAATNWWRAYTHSLTETGVSDWRNLRSQIGLDSNRSTIRKKVGLQALPLDGVYDSRYVATLLRGVMTEEEIRSLLFR